MNAKEVRFQTLVDRAKCEPIPPIDLADRVVDRIATTHPQREAADWWLWSVAGLSVAAAAAVLLIAFQQEALFYDPMADWLHPLVVVMQ